MIKMAVKNGLALPGGTKEKTLCLAGKRIIFSGYR